MQNEVRVKKEYRKWEKWLGFLSFPYRSVILNPNESKKHFMCLRDERMYYIRELCKGKVLDVGCGPDNVFIKNFYDKNGLGIDFHAYPGLEETQVVSPAVPFPLESASFDTVTLIANVNHIPTSIIEPEFTEIARVLKPGGRLLITRIGLIVSFMTHNVVKIQSKISDKYYDMDTERGMEEDERLTVSRREIRDLATKNGLKLQGIRKLWTQWALNEILIFEKV